MSCARTLQSKGVDFLLLEASDRPGGRVKTESINGFLLDHGFQVYLDSYNEGKLAFNLDQLELCPFMAGSLVWVNGGFDPFVDPIRHPTTILDGIFKGPATLKDKLKLFSLKQSLSRKSLSAIRSDPVTKTSEYLKMKGFSGRCIEAFFTPFLRGIFLEEDLQTSSRVFELVFHHFSNGNACLPNAGMETLPRQMVGKLDSDRILTNAPVLEIEGKTVTVGGDIQCKLQAKKSVVIATSLASDLPGAIGASPSFPTQAVTCYYYSADRSPLKKKLLVLNGEGQKSGPINNLCVPSDIAPGYAPEGKVLISVSVLGAKRNTGTEKAVRQQLVDWYGGEVTEWESLESFEIKHALPQQTMDSPVHEAGYLKLSDELWICGDHLGEASINSALGSGRAAAESILDRVYS